jgi:hypothetical protein
MLKAIVTLTKPRGGDVKTPRQVGVHSPSGWISEQKDGDKVRVHLPWGDFIRTAETPASKETLFASMKMM